MFDMQVFTGTSYLIAAVLFILGIKRLGSPATARSGNLMAAIGMLVVVVVTLLDQQVLNYGMVLSGILAGSIVGALAARTIRMTAMPQLVAIFNGLGGGASALVASSEFLRLLSDTDKMAIDVSVTTMLGTVIGLVTFSGSIVAFGKLQEIVATRPVTFPLQKTLNVALFLAIVGITVYLVTTPGFQAFVVLGVLCLVLGVMLVMPIGGADMPVVVSLLNSYSGLAVAAAGFVLGNVMLIVAGALVGAAGLILTQIMTKAMNRSLINVIFGAFGASTVEEADLHAETRYVRRTTFQDAAILVAYARSAILVPGYGLAVSQAQHQLRELADIIETRGTRVKYAIHPVAGRMPGHMNVLLAEADVPYDRLFDRDQINDEFSDTDVVLVVGANDVVNPDARKETGPIAGMPILDVDKARTCIVIKRSLSPGFAGIPNPLFAMDNTLMLFGDGKKALLEMISALKEI